MIVKFISNYLLLGNMQSPQQKYGQAAVVFDMYSDLVGQLNEVMNPLFGELCQDKCALDPYNHCCNDMHYKEGMPTDMLRRQKAEADQNSWTYLGDSCLYHTENGCAIPKTKPPLCAGSVCVDVRQALIDEFGWTEAHRLINPLSNVYESSLYGAQIQFAQDGTIDVLTHLKDAIQSGKQLLEARR